MKKLVMVLGIRPDVIRASIFINLMREQKCDNFVLIWSGQHYSTNLKDIFFRELGLDGPNIELGFSGTTDAEIVGSLLPKLSNILEELKPSAVIFLGDTNTVMGSIAAAQLNIPVIHIEGCMRSYDWRMPEEKYRKVTDHLSDLIFAYLPEYREQGLAEGIPAENIEVVGNPIVDVLQNYFLDGRLKLTDHAFASLMLDKYGLKKGQPYALMTSHRRENVENEMALKNIMKLAAACDVPVIFPTSYRTQKSIINFNITLPSNIISVDPIGYLEILELLTHSQFALTDSGTLVEEACILGTPSIQMRHSTERPQVYLWGSSIKFDPINMQSPIRTVEKVNSIERMSWNHKFGNGDSSKKIFDSITNKYYRDELGRHDPKIYLPWSANSFLSD